MKKSLLFACAFLCIAAAVDGKKKEEAAAPADAIPTQQQIYRENKREIADRKAKHGKSLYIGEGVAEIKKDVDLGDAKRMAKDRAMADMLSSIRVRVKAVIKDELKYSDSSGTSQKIERLIESYVNQVLDIVQDTYYLDYPRQGDITVIAYVSKAAYDESVAKDMQIKTDRVKGYAVEGAKAQAARKISQAIENYVNGKIWLKNYFDELPVKAGIKKNGAPEDLGSYFDTQLTQIMSSIKLETADENIVYNTEGKVSRKPMVIFNYEDASGRAPLTDMPAKASFAKGTGTISSTPLRTGRRGEVYVPLDWVDPAEREATVQVELDAAALRLKNSQTLPVVFIPIRKSKAVAWAVSFFKDGKREQSSSLADSVKMALSATGYELKAFNIYGREITAEVVAEARSLNVDYVVYAYVVASSRKDEYGMYKSGASSRAYIYSFYDDRLIETIEGPARTGYNISASGAAYEALSRLKPGLLDAMKEKIKTLK